MKYLFICHAGIKRSPAAAYVSKQIAREKDIKDYQTDYSGIGPILTSRNPFANFDRVFVMDEKLEKLVKNMTDKPITNLDVSDQHSISERKFRELLERELREKLEPFFEA